MTPQEAAVVVNALGDAFATGEVDAVVERFTDLGQMMYAGSEHGEVAVGLPALRRLLADLFSRSERYSWRCTSVHITGSTAGYSIVADATLFVDPWPSRPDGPTGASFPYRVSGLLEESDDGWRWRFCHGSEPTPPATAGEVSTGPA